MGEKLDYCNAFSQVEFPVELAVNDYDDFAAVYDEIMGCDYANIIIEPYYATIAERFKYCS